MSRFALAVAVVFTIAVVGAIGLAVIAFKMTDAVTNLP